MLKLKLQYTGHLMRRADSLEKTLMLGKIEGRRRRGWQRMRWLDGITDSVDMGLGGQYFGCIPEIDDRQGGLASFGAWGSKVSDRTERLKWTDTLFSSEHGTFFGIDHILGHKSNLNKFKKIEIVTSIFSDHNNMRLDINHKKKCEKHKQVEMKQFVSK